MIALLVPLAVSVNSANASFTLNILSGQGSGVSVNSGYGYSSGSGSQCSSGSLTLCSLIVRAVGYLDQILFLLIGLSVVTFVFYVWKFFIKPNENRDEAGKYVMYSVIGFFVILSMWGLVNILQNTFGIGNVGYSQNSWSDLNNLFPTN